MTLMPAAQLSAFVFGEDTHEDHANETVAEHEAHEEESGDVHEHTGSVTQDYWNLLTDPAHAMVEVTYMLLGEILIALILLPLIKKYFNFRLAKAHAELDREHGISHDPETGTIINKHHPDSH